MKLSHKINITLFFAMVAPLIVPVFLLFKNINEFQERSLLNLLSSISSGLVPSITFESKDGAQAYLQDTVKNVSGAKYAVVFTKDGKLFAEWGKSEKSKTHIKKEWISSVLEGKNVVKVKGGNLVIGVPIFDTSSGKKEIIGALFLTAKKHSIAGEITALLLGVGSISVVIFGIALTILRRVSKEIDLIVREISKSSEGKIASVPFQSDDEIGQIAKSWNNLVSKLKEVVSGIVEYSRKIEDFSVKVSSGSAELSQSVDHQVANLSEVAKSVEEFTETLKGISERMRQVSTLAQESLEVARAGAESSGSIGETMKKFSQTMNEVLNTFSELSASVVKINQITDTVREIAERTNLLSLNAAIEAARAGEMGRGFAVVAQEVGELAARTNRELTKIEETTRLVLSAVDRVNENLQRVGEDFRKIKDQSEIMRKDFTNILEKSEETSNTATIVSQQISNHLKNIEDISERISSVTQANEQIGTMAFELAKVAEEMRTVSDKLYKAVEFFKMQEERK